jgi:antitoxin (DNA-binding transcriptional repressor) of toxin-antitoxin stability system
LKPNIPKLAIKSWSNDGASSIIAALTAPVALIIVLREISAPGRPKSLEIGETKPTPKLKPGPPIARPRLRRARYPTQL